MVELDFSKCNLKPFQHQREDVAWLVENEFAFIASEMRTGKSAIAIIAAQFLFEANLIDRVIVVCPAPVRDVWYDPTFGELAKHLWVPAYVQDFHSTSREWIRPEGKVKVERRMAWHITNFEFIGRSKERLRQLSAAASARTFLIGDESAYLKNHEAMQTIAFKQLRWMCGRVLLLNGTPIYHTPLDLFSQGNILHPKILQCEYITRFKAKYAVQEPVLGHGGKAVLSPRGKQPLMKIAGWRNLEDLRQRFSPYTVRRLQKDCLDLPPKLDPVVLTATLKESWPHYVAMKREMVVWLNENTVASSSTAAIKTLRLSQITSGYLGGIEKVDVKGKLESTELETGLLDSLDFGEMYGSLPGGRDTRTVEEERKLTEADFRYLEEHRGDDTLGPQDSLEIGREKLDVLLWFLEQCLSQEENFKAVIWCKFRAELARAVAEVTAKFPRVQVAQIHGGQKKQERVDALSLLHPKTAPTGPVLMFGTYGTGSFGINLSAANTSISLSNDHSLGKYLQSADRIYGPGMLKSAAYFDIVAVGPKGQKTIDHAIIEARRNNQDVANWTQAEWVKALSRED